MEPAYEEKERNTFWLSLFSAIGVLAILGVILYLSQISDNSKLSNPGVQPGIGGGPGTSASPSASPTESPAPSETPAETPQPTSMPQTQTVPSATPSIQTGRW